jgi:predicted MPP superfamily phosphohydrolase
MTEQSGKISRRGFLKNVGAMLLATGAGCYSTSVETEFVSIERVTVPLKKLPSAVEGFKIVLMSDFHLYPYTKIDYIRKVVAEANALKPDIIALTGDYVSHRSEAIFELAPVLGGLNATHGIYAVLGNHDIWSGANIIKQGLGEAKLTVLKNQTVPISVGESNIYVAGLDDGWAGQPDLRGALEPVPGAGTTVLLMHEPDFADNYANDGRVSLQLSGHTHGGQVRLPGIGALKLPPYGKKYDQGLYKVRDMWLYTTRGIGVIAVPVRFNCRPEITELTLVKG